MGGLSVSQYQIPDKFGQGGGARQATYLKMGGYL